MTLHEDVRKQLLQSLQQPANNGIDQLNDAFRLLAKWRSILISNTIIAAHKTHVLQGPMKGLEYVANTSEGCLAARLIGCYEQPLLPFIEEAINTDYKNVVNIGCSDGYYAVGMARRMPNSKMWAYDINQAAQDACTELAQKNNVSERIEIGALFGPEDFAQFANEKTLVMCDIEGAEQELLDPQLAPELAGMEGEGRPNQALDQGDSASQKLDQMLAEAKIGPELIEGLGSGLKSLSSNVNSMSDLTGASVATKEYADNLHKANEQIIGMNTSYGRAVSALDGLTESTESFKETTTKKVTQIRPIILCCFVPFLVTKI